MSVMFLLSKILVKLSQYSIDLFLNFRSKIPAQLRGCSRTMGESTEATAQRLVVGPFSYYYFSTKSMI